MKLDENVLLTTTTNRPMVRAAAVAAVTQRIREHGVAASPPLREMPCAAARRARRTVGMITNGASIAMPANIAIVSEIPYRPDMAEPLPLPPQNSPPSSRPGTNRAAPITSRAVRGDWRTPRAPSTARIGATRPARRAGQAAPNVVTRSPSTTAVTAGPAVMCTAPTGISMPRMSAHQPLRQREPESSPSRAPRDTDQRGLEQDRARDLAARGAERAQGADLAHALQHGHVEGVEDQEAADEQGDPGEEGEDDVQRVQLLSHLVAKPSGVLI